MYKLLKWNKNVYSHALFITQVLSYLENLKKIKKNKGGNGIFCWYGNISKFLILPRLWDLTYMQIREKCCNIQWDAQLTHDAVGLQVFCRSLHHHLALDRFSY